MNDLLALPLRDLARRIANRDVTAAAIVRALIARIEANESRVRAWQFFDPALALRQAKQRDAGAILGALHGVPIGVKDLMDTADMPTAYGSQLYTGHRPTTDAAVVAASRAAGAIVMGKTVTTEFATYQPGPTVNPRVALSTTPDVPRTPGGSSSGSAAAVASGMVPLAFGTQTAGSIIRPAAYCGIVGYKPTHGTLSLAGIKALSPSLDTAGVLARSVDDAAFFVGALARWPLHGQLLEQAASGRIRVGICQTPHWERASPDARAALARAARLLEQRGATLRDLPAANPDGNWMQALSQAQIDIMAHEAHAAFAPELSASPDGLSSAFRALLASGLAVDGQRFFAAQQQAASARHAFDALFNKTNGGAGLDIVLAPSTEGEAPLGLDHTGDPIFNRMWTLLGNPCVHVPLGNGSNKMPIGVTVIGPRWGDMHTLAIARRLECAHLG